MSSLPVIEIRPVQRFRVSMDLLTQKGGKWNRSYFAGWGFVGTIVTCNNPGGAILCSQSGAQDVARRLEEFGFSGIRIEEVRSG